MNKKFNFIVGLMLFIGINMDAMNNIKAIAESQSCFSFYHDLYNEYYGGITLETVGDFNENVANCQRYLE